MIKEFDKETSTGIHHFEMHYFDKNKNYVESANQADIVIAAEFDENGNMINEMLFQSEKYTEEQKKNRIIIPDNSIKKSK